MPACPMTKSELARVFNESLLTTGLGQVRGLFSGMGSHLLGELFSLDNLLVRVHFIIEMIRWTGLAP